MAEPCTVTPGCRRPAGHVASYPCGGPLIQVGDPCTRCGDPIRADANGHPEACPACWQPLTLADAKAIFAEAGLSVDLRPNGGAQ